MSNLGQSESEWWWNEGLCSEWVSIVAECETLIRVTQNCDRMSDYDQSDSDWWQNEGLGSEWSHHRAAEPRVSKVPIIQLQRGEIRAQRRFCPTISQPLHTLKIKYSQTAGNQANTNIGGLKHQVQSIWKHLCKVTETPFYFWLILSRSIQNVRVNKLEPGAACSVLVRVHEGT